MLLDLSDPAFVADPYPRLAQLRQQGDLVWDEDWQSWLATTHRSVSAVLRSRAFGRIWSDREPTAEFDDFNKLHRHQMMENEPPEHTRLRRLVAGAFGRGHVERLRPQIASLAENMVAELPTQFDVLSQYAEPFPVFVIADLLGVPRADHEDLRRWSQSIVRMYEPGVSDELQQQALRASADFSQYVREVIKFRKNNPGDDLITDLIAERDQSAATGSQSLTEDELVAAVVLLLNAGHEASVNVFGNGINALLRNEQQLALLLDGSVEMETALEELIRYDAPLQLFERTAVKDTEVLGQPVVAGQKVACLMGSANRDAAVFDRADSFDISRDPNPHVGFGMGLHFCLGAPLARLELQLSLQALLDHCGALELVAEPPRRPTWVLRGFEHIEVKAA